VSEKRNDILYLTEKKVDRNLPVRDRFYRVRNKSIISLEN